MKTLKRVLMLMGALSVIAVIAGVVILVYMVRHGFSARDRPSRAEALLAETMRSLSIPSAARSRANPMKTLTPESMMMARGHFADHCAQCHANDGSGNTEMGRNLYPKPPDMRARGTQDKSDGELFFIIQNGIRLTGMPAWGEAGHDEEESWMLVSFIRRLPSLTDEDLAAMEYLNPKSPEEWKEQQEEAAFLAGGPSPRPATPSHQHGGHP
jgi:hypothetical protein